MTDDEIKAHVGDKPAGSIETHSADEVKRITAILQEKGYRWKLAYTIDGATCVVMFYVDPH